MKCCTRSFGLLGLAVALAAAAGFASSDDKKTEWKGDIYTLDVCVVTGKKLGSMGDPVTKVIGGREVRFCCEPCIEKLEADSETYFKRIDEALIEQQMPHYPLKTCVVMPDDPLEGMHDEPAQVVYKNRLVRFCCGDCIKEFNADPAKYIATLDAAVIEQQKDKYPLKTCPVSGEDLGGMGEPVNYVVGTMLVRFCCAECVKSFEKNPQPVIKKVHEAWMASHKDGDHGASKESAGHKHDGKDKDGTDHAGSDGDGHDHD